MSVFLDRKLGKLIKNRYSQDGSVDLTILYIILLYCTFNGLKYVITECAETKPTKLRLDYGKSNFTFAVFSKDLAYFPPTIPLIDK